MEDWWHVGKGGGVLGCGAVGAPQSGKAKEP